MTTLRYCVKFGCLCKNILEYIVGLVAQVSSSSFFTTLPSLQETHYFRPLGRKELAVGVCNTGKCGVHRYHEQIMLFFSVDKTGAGGGSQKTRRKKAH